MTKVCPNPVPWNAFYQKLLGVWKSRPDLPKPPVPLILDGWVFSNDIEKMGRWQETLQWAQAAGCAPITASLSDDDFYQTEALSNYQIGPLGGPMYREWDFESKQKPSSEVLAAAMQRLNDQWPALASGFSTGTHPVGFTGEKACRLLVAVNGKSSPPWGTWESLSDDKQKRRTFTAFRKEINKTIHPHEVDHVDFVMQKKETATDPETEETAHALINGLPREGRLEKADTRTRRTA